MTKVLLVEDDEVVRRALRLCLSANNYVVDGVGTKREALQRLSVDEADLPDVVVLDLRLPNGHGREVVEQLKRERDDVPVVILSACPHEALLGFPVVAVLKKPTKRSDLLNAVAHAAKAADVVEGLRKATRRLREQLPGKEEEGTVQDG